MKLIKKRVSALCALSFFISYCYARVFEVEGRERLLNAVNRSNIAIVYLYAFDKKCYPEKNCINQDKCRFKNVSANNRYNYAGLKFFTSNIARTLSLQQELHIAQLPALVVFDQGIPINAQSICGTLSELTVQNFIENALTNRIDTIVERREIHEEKLEEARIRASYCCWPGWYTPCWPYSYWGPCYRPCGYRWGCGWGCW